MDSYQNKNVDPCVSLFAPNKVKTDIPNRCRVNKCFCFFGGRALFWCLGPLSFRQQHLNDIEYSNLTILVLQQNDSTIKFVGTCLSFSNKCLFEFPTMFGFPMPPWVSTSSQTHQFCRLKARYWHSQASGVWNLSFAPFLSWIVWFEFHWTTVDRDSYIMKSICMKPMYFSI